MAPTSRAKSSRSIRNCELFGIAGAQMRAAGVAAKVRIEDIHGLGLTELISTIGLSLATMRDLRRDPAHRQTRPRDPDRLCRVQPGAGRDRANARACRCSTTSRRRSGRGGAGASEKSSTRANRLAVVLPFEEELYARGRRAGELRRSSAARSRRARAGPRGNPRAPRPAALFEAAGAAARQPPRRGALHPAADGRGRAHAGTRPSASSR